MLENNPTEFSVTEISSKIKFLLESNLGYVRIKGEISGLKIADSGHGYFSLKDTGAVLGATCWRHNLAKMNFKLTEGLEIIATGKITAYAGQSKYQISVEAIEPAGAGAFMQILKERKEKLAKEGLFDKEHKKPIPFLPQKIGIITSLSGAVIRDIIHRISDRFPVHLYIMPVSVQGKTASEEITNAINSFNELQGEYRPDLLIVARGGGSIEDLWPFNEENVVRATFASQIPIISAVGHETDYTLIDLASDLRAPTPTAAAEFAVPVLADLRHSVSSLYNNILHKVSKAVKHNRDILSNYDRILYYPKNYIGNYMQKLDELEFRLKASLPNLIAKKKMNLQYFPISRLIPTKVIQFRNMRLARSSENLIGTHAKCLQNAKHKLELSYSLLVSLDYNKVLKRGYAMIKGPDGHYLSTKAQASAADFLTIKLQDGEIKAVPELTSFL